MTAVTVVRRDGGEQILESKDGWSLMEVMREGGVDEVLALCGGCCSCATCHVFIDQAWLDRVGPPRDDEDVLLESSAHRTPASRLACQITLGAGLNGIRVTVAPEE
jgi:2Fe-2S ferredoxin